MTLLVGSWTVGLILALLALGVFISFRIFAFPDITADGSLTLGAAVAAALIVRGYSPWGATAAAMLPYEQLENQLDAAVRGNSVDEVAVETARRWLASAPPVRTARDFDEAVATAVESLVAVGFDAHSDAIGDSIVSEPRTVTRADIDHFAEFTGDTFYAHTDPSSAAANPLFGGIVAHGYLVVSLAAGLFVEPNPGPVLANFGVDNLRFLTPVKADDTIRVTLTVKQITPRTTADYGEVRWDCVVTNQDDQPVATYDVLTLVAKNA